MKLFLSVCMLMLVCATYCGCSKDKKDIYTAPVEVATDAALPASVNVPYSYQLPATGGGETNYVWTLEAGELPPGISFLSTGVLTGTPQETGIYSFTVRVHETTFPFISDSCSKKLTMNVEDWHWAVELSWTDTEDGNPTSPAESPHAVVDEAGTCYAVWAVNDGVNPRYIVCAEKAGIAAVKIYDVTDGSSDCKSPKIVVDSSGIVHVLYLAWDGASYDLMHLSGSPGSWGSASAVSSDAIEDYDLAIDESGILYASYVVSTANKVLYYSFNDGTGWSAQEQVGTADSSTCVSIAAGSTELAAILWSRTEATTDTTVCYTKGTAAWSETEVTTSLAGCDIAVTEEVFHLAWVEGGQAYYASLTDEGLSGTLTLSQTGTVSGPLQIALAEDDFVWVAWLDTSGSNDELCYVRVEDGKTLGDAFNLTSRFSSHTPAADVTDYAISDTTEAFPHIIFPKSGTLYVTYSTLLPWSYPETIADTTGIAVFADGACDQDGKYHVAFTDNSTGSFDIYYLSKDGTWSAPTNLSQSTDDSTRPHVIVVSGAVYVIWFEFVGPALDDVNVVWRSKLPASSWSSVQTAFSTKIPGGFGYCFGTHAMYVPGTPLGQIRLFWSAMDTVSGDWCIYSSTFDISTSIWTTPEIVGQVAGRDCFFADAAMTSDGTIHLVWGAYGEISGSPTDGFIYYSYFDGQDWSAPVEVSGNAANTKAHQPAISVDELGNCYVFWVYGNTPTPWVQACTEVRGRVIDPSGGQSNVFLLERKDGTIQKVNTIFLGGYIFVAFSASPAAGYNNDILLKWGVRGDLDLLWQKTVYASQIQGHSFNQCFVPDEAGGSLYLFWNGEQFGDYDIFGTLLTSP